MLSGHWLFMWSTVCSAAHTRLFLTTTAELSISFPPASLQNSTKPAGVGIRSTSLHCFLCIFACVDGGTNSRPMPSVPCGYRFLTCARCLADSENQWRISGPWNRLWSHQLARRRFGRSGTSSIPRLSTGRSHGRAAYRGRGRQEPRRNAPAAATHMRHSRGEREKRLKSAETATVRNHVHRRRE